MQTVKRTVHITQEDIDNGSPKDPSCCAGALAIAREFPECAEVYVQPGEVVYYPPNDNRHAAVAPPELTKFVEVYDKQEKSHSKPTSFELELVLP